MAENKHTREELAQWQALPLGTKVNMTKHRIREWVNEYGIDGVYVSFSGGKDSTVLLNIAREMYGDSMKAMFVDIPTQYPELRTFVNGFRNVDIERPKKSFIKICEEYGFPLISKEVSECVSGARKYLTSIKSEIALSKQASKRYDYQYRKLTGQGEYAKTNEGGYDNKYRKLRGIGEYSKCKNGCKTRWEQSEISDNARVANERQADTDKGECP